MDLCPTRDPLRLLTQSKRNTRKTLVLGLPINRGHFTPQKGKNKQILHDSVRTTSAVDLRRVLRKATMRNYTNLWQIRIERQYRQEDRDTPRQPAAVTIQASSQVDARKNIRRKKSEFGRIDDLSQPWVCAETDPFTLKSVALSTSPKTLIPSSLKTYNGSEDPEDHLKIFQAAAKTERWAMPTWCHMFNSTLTGNARVWFDDLPPESIDSYNDLREAFQKNYLQQKKCIRDPIVLHNIKQRDGESTEDFIQRYKSESGNVKGAPECMRIFGFVHGITNPELIKRFHEKIPKTVDEMMQVATSFLQGREEASNQERKKVPASWRHRKGGSWQNYHKRGRLPKPKKDGERPTVTLFSRKL
ncbi:reverse transcriptase domain-containing protein [Tanacetum coccineum]